jgi:4-methylaminobutanoate oxidase (formaldehyde-forming)
VTVRCGVEVRRIDEQQSGRFRLTTDAGVIEAERLVLTAGPWTGQLAARLGTIAGMHPIRLQQARTNADHVPETRPVLRVPDESCYVRPEAGGYLFGFFDPDPLPIDLDEQAGSFRTASVLPEHRLIHEAVERLQPLLPRLGELPIASYRQGMMTCTPDGKFVLGPVSNEGRVWMATGCGGTGIAASGAVGRWIAGGMITGDPGEDLAQYAVHRFGQQVADRQWLRERACATSAAYYRIPPSPSSE